VNPLLYLLGLVPGILALVGLLVGGVWAWATPLFVFGLVPVVELVWTRPLRDRRPAPLDGLVADVLLFATLPLNLGALALLVVQVARGAHGGLSLAGCIVSVGIVLGMYGLNSGHELGHRGGTLSRAAAQVLMGSALYAHFWVEHNLGHHARVATPEDPASARRGEWLFGFWVRSVAGGARSAFGLAPRRVLLGWLAQVLAVLAVGWVAGAAAAGAWVASAVVGVLLLETVNYVEHYGLRRERLPSGRFERVAPRHSWNSEHPLGRMLLFDLPRHADHHANPRRRCVELRCFADAPQLPSGYPAMILLALAPPVFVWLMDRQVRRTGAGAEAIRA
jgi:alkane 1-monooxygenase